jgi:lysozyme
MEIGRLRALVILVLACALASCGGPRREAPVSRAATDLPRFADTDPHPWDGIKPWHYPVHGIDVSRYQGEIDWAGVRASGIAFAFIKATEGGDHADASFGANWRGALYAGVRRGAYHFYYFCRTAPEQARWFIEHVPRDAAALPPVLDIEWNHRSRTCPHRPDPETVRAEAQAFLRIVAAHYGRRPVIYSTVDFYNENELWRLQGYEFWLRSVAGHPSAVYPTRNWTFWQYTGTGLVGGVSGHTDINVFAGSEAQWQQWLALNGL